MATGIVDPKKDTVAVLDQSQVYGLYHASAATHDLILPVNQRFIIMILDTAVNYSGIIHGCCLSAGSVVAANISTGGSYLSLNTVPLTVT